jgi:hypothetical protein
VAQALRLIHEHACDGIFARDIVPQVPLLLLIFGICCLLWIFRRGLFPGVDQWLRSVMVFLGLEMPDTEGPDSAKAQ